MVNRWAPTTSDEAGMTVMELIVASAMLLLVVAIALGGLASFQQSQEFARNRSATLDELRLAAAAFSREARQASSVTVTGTAPSTGCNTATVVCGNRVVLNTFAAGQPVTTVTWEIKQQPAGSGNVRLVRTTALGTTRTYGDRLLPVTSSSSQAFFAYRFITSSDPNAKSTLTVRLSTQPQTRHPIVSLTSKVTTRNVA